MLRKALVSALILLYSLSVIGVPVHYHYCKGELKHVSVLVRTGCEGEEMAMRKSDECCKKSAPQCSKGKCCSDAMQWLQENIPSILVNNATPKTLALTAVILRIIDNFSIADTNVQPAVARVEPHTGSPPIYLFTCSLIYYG